jgi:hypothetical protein
MANLLPRLKRIERTITLSHQRRFDFRVAGRSPSENRQALMAELLRAIEWPLISEELRAECLQSVSQLKAIEESE